jgi:hypothetical protein
VGQCEKACHSAMDWVCDSRSTLGGEQHGESLRETALL